ncbi:MAG: T9SS type A sorting domain-containing protein [Candidatus Marinimicrobia bacterium]|nr:T9SS type A sorting domain-containing protein [Candidatus Neomarinimicrobiota bacterium]
MKKLKIKILLMLLSIISINFADTLKVLEYLYSISGENILAGQHNREPNSDPDKWTEYIFEATGKYPALWSADFLFQQDNIDNRWTMIYEAKEQWDNGAVVSIMWHACPPDQPEPCNWNTGIINSQLSDAQWTELLTEGAPLNTIFKSRMDEIATYLQYLEDEGVEVLWKPFHEMNQGAFWWGGRPGPEGTAKLYRFLYEYFTNEKGLSNLVWVWDMQDLSRDFEDYNPGDAYWDIFAFDIYDNGFDKSWYDYILSIVGDKPIAIGECAELPTAGLLQSQPRWVYFLSWAELVQSHNTLLEIREIYSDPHVITRDEMPGWGDFGEIPFRIEIASNADQLLNNGIMTTEIKAMLKDEDGKFCGNATNEIIFSIIGKGTFTTNNIVNATGGRASIVYQSPLEQGFEKIVASSQGLISDTIDIEITGILNFDDFENYDATYELELYWQEKSTSMVRLYLEKLLANDGTQSMKFNYKIGEGAPPYAAIYKENSADLSGCKYFGFWYQPTGRSNQLAIRLTERNGTHWDFYFDIEGNEGLYTEIALADFIRYSGLSDSINLSEIVEVSLNILKGNGEYGEGIIYFDSIKFLTENSIVSIDEAQGHSPEKFYMEQNYPNPFNPKTTIEYQLKISSDVRLNIYDIRGVLVQKLVNEYKIAGKYQVLWDAEDFPSGLYVYQLVAGETIHMRKCLLLK